MKIKSQPTPIPTRFTGYSEFSIRVPAVTMTYSAMDIYAIGAMLQSTSGNIETTLGFIWRSRNPKAECCGAWAVLVDKIRQLLNSGVPFERLIPCWESKHRHKFVPLTIPKDIKPAIKRRKRKR